MVRRAIVGAHYGWMDFLAQRITAVVMAVYTLLVIAIALYSGGIDYAAVAGAVRHTRLSASPPCSLRWRVLWHAWIGMRDIWMDYIKPTALRLTLEVLTVIVLVATSAGCC